MKSLSGHSRCVTVAWVDIPLMTPDRQQDPFGALLLFGPCSYGTESRATHRVLCWGQPTFFVVVLSLHRGTPLLCCYMALCRFPGIVLAELSSREGSERQLHPSVAHGEARFGPSQHCAVSVCCVLQTMMWLSSPWSVPS